MTAKRSNIYLDHAAATPVRSEVVRAMQPYWADTFANPSSITQAGQAARTAVEAARAMIAELLNARPEEIIFTASGTESANLAIRGIMTALGGGHCIVSAGEHHAVREPAEQLAQQGVSVSIAPINRDGIIDLHALEAAVQPETRLIATIYANNEIGTIQPMDRLSRLLRRINRERRQKQLPPIYWYTDACQAAGYLSLDVNELGVDALTLNAAKVGGPKGVGVLYLRRGVPLRSQVYGGSQEYGRRAGTENVPAIVGLAQALKLARAETVQEGKRLSGLRDVLFAELVSAFPDIQLNGHPTYRLPNNLNLTLPGIDAEAAVLYLDRDGLIVGTGAACSNTTLEPSHVLLAIGRNPNEALSSLRITLGHTTTKEDVVRAGKILVKRLSWLKQYAA